LHRVTFVFQPFDPVSPTHEILPDDTELQRAPEGAIVRVEEHLTQWVIARGGAVEACYVFDDVYRAAHPESVDARHLAMLHALITFKLFDDGDVLIPPAQLAGVVRWPSLTQPPRALTDERG
jgi:hypothetical protein